MQPAASSNAPLSNAATSPRPRSAFASPQQRSGGRTDQPSMNSYSAATMNARTLSAGADRDTKKQRRQKSRSLDLTALMEPSLVDTTNLQRDAPISKPHSRLKRVSSRIWSGNTSKNSDESAFVDVPSAESGLPSDPNSQEFAGGHEVYDRANFNDQSVQQTPTTEPETVLPRKLTGWFANILHSQPQLHASSSSNLSKSSNSESVNPPRNPLSFVDRRWFDKAANYLFDTDANVDRCQEDIWLLGVCHEGWRPPAGEQPLMDVYEKPPQNAEQSPPGSNTSPRKRLRLKGKGKEKERRNFGDRNQQAPTVPLSASPDWHILAPSRPSLSPHSSTSSVTRRSSNTSTSSQALPTISNTSNAVPENAQSSLLTLQQTNGWPQTFYLDFISRIQLTYRTGFPPIVNVDSPGRQANGLGGFRDMVGSLASSIGRRDQPASTPGPNNGGLGLTSDAGWGCMLRTGQSLLANALAEHHLGRDWRRTITREKTNNSSAEYLPPQSLSPDYGKYARLVSWFMDDPSEFAPFSVHKFALEGKKLGKDVGQWFGPSTAAGAISALANNYEPANIAVLNTVDGAVYLSEVAELSQDWSKPVLILLNLRLGLQGVNPIYHPAIKALYTFTQCVGIAGGRPSSSYYFVGAQADSLFYIDPHYPKPSVVVRHPTDPEVSADARELPLTLSSKKLDMPVDNFSARDDFGENDDADENWYDAESESVIARPRTRQSSNRSQQNPAKAELLRRAKVDQFFAEAYPPDDLLTFHPDRVRKMALSGLDPSMLVGFLIHDAEDLREWQQRSSELKPALYSVQDQPPQWARRTAPSRATSFNVQAVSSGTPQPGSVPSEPSEGDWDISDDESAADGDFGGK